MILLPDDPIISCAERTGFPPWISPYWEDDEEPEEEEDDDADF
jgi:hypothetical protein